MLPLQRELDELKRQYEEVKREIFAATLARKYLADQPRVPAGNPDGSQWTTAGGGTSAGAGQQTTDAGAGTSDSRVISDATPDNDWEPGAQYARGAAHSRSGEPSFRAVSVIQSR